MPTAVLTPKQAVLEALEKRRRLPELEATVLQDPIAACYYAKNVVKGRWEASEPVIASGLHRKFVDFNILDNDNRVRYNHPGGGHYMVGPRPQGTDHVKKGNALELMTVYIRLAGCRVPAFESELSKERWKGNTYKYCQMVYMLTGELIDLDSPEVCSWMIKELCYDRVSKKIGRAERIRVCKELHKRMILHSFAKGDNGEVRKYFKEYKKSENHFLVFMSQHDENMTVGDLIRSMVGESN